MEDKIIKTSELYWMFGMLLTILLVIGHYVKMIYLGTEEYIWLISAGIIFIYSLFINHNKRIKNKFDKE